MAGTCVSPSQTIISDVSTIFMSNDCFILFFQIFQVKFLLRFRHTLLNLNATFYFKGDFDVVALISRLHNNNNVVAAAVVTRNIMMKFKDS